MTTQELLLSICGMYERLVPMVEKRLSFRPGLTDAELDEFSASFGKPFPDDLRDFYRFGNGIATGWIPYFGEFLSLEKAIARNARYTKTILDEAVDPWETIYDFSRVVRIKKNLWNRFWIPITVNAGSHLIVDLDPPSDGDYGQVIYYSRDEGPNRVEAKSLKKFLEVFLRYFETDQFEWREEDSSLYPKNEVTSDDQRVGPW